MNKSNADAQRTFRERRVALGRGIRELATASGVNRGRLSIIERGVVPTLAEHAAIEAALREWETA